MAGWVSGTNALVSGTVALVSGTVALVSGTVALVSVSTDLNLHPLTSTIRMAEAPPLL